MRISRALAELEEAVLRQLRDWGIVGTALEAPSDPVSESPSGLELAR